MIKPGLTVHRLELFLAVLDHGEVRRLRAGSLTIGASTTPGTYLLPAALGRFHATYPGITLRLEISDTREIERSVAVGQLELGVIGEAPLVPGLAAEPWVTDELVLIVPRGHPFTRRRAVTAHAIAVEAYIAREEGSSTRGVAERNLARLGVTLTPAMELGSTEAIREAVAAGLGVALVSRHAVLARDRRIVAVRLADSRWTRDLLIVQRSGTPVREHDGCDRPGLRSRQHRNRCGVRASWLETHGQAGAERGQRSSHTAEVSCCGVQIRGPGVGFGHGGHGGEQFPPEIMRAPQGVRDPAPVVQSSELSQQDHPSCRHGLRFRFDTERVCDVELAEGGLVIAVQLEDTRRGAVGFGLGGAGDQPAPGPRPGRGPRAGPRGRQ